jgi:hypothetical protein
MSNGGDKGHHQEKKVERKEPQAVAGKPTSGQVKRPTSGK